jgi:TIR domain
MRDMLFLSHANREDNEFTQWLALQLAHSGYPVWCDLTKLLGGEDFWKDAEQAIRARTVKFLYVLSRTSNAKDGPLQELTVAKNVARDLELHDFIIPLLIDDLAHKEINIQLARLNAISFRPGWAPGLANLLAKLEKDHIAKSEKFSPDAVTEWWRTNFSAGAGVSDEPEQYLSSWFPIGRSGRKLSHYFKPKLSHLSA